MWGVIHWAALCVAAAALIVLGMFVYGEAFGKSRTPWKITEVLLGVCFFIAAAGLIVGFRHERLGGGIALCAMSLFYAVNYLASGLWPRGPWFFLVFALPAALFLLAGDHVL